MHHRSLWISYWHMQSVANVCTIGDSLTLGAYPSRTFDTSFHFVFIFCIQFCSVQFTDFFSLNREIVHFSGDFDSLSSDSMTNIEFSLIVFSIHLYLDHRFFPREVWSKADGWISSVKSASWMIHSSLKWNEIETLNLWNNLTTVFICEIKGTQNIDSENGGTKAVIIRYCIIRKFF